MQRASLARIQLRLLEGVVAIVGFPSFIIVAAVWMNRIGRQPSFREPSICICTFSQRVRLAVGSMKRFSWQAVYLSCVHALKVKVTLLIRSFQVFAHAQVARSVFWLYMLDDACPALMGPAKFLDSFASWRSALVGIDVVVFLARYDGLPRGLFAHRFVK